MESTKLTRSQLARYIDHTQLSPEAGASAVASAAREAADLGVYSVCVSPSMLPLEGATLPVVAVCGFPSGKHSGAIKAAEAAESVANGAVEIDMVIDLGAAVDNDFETVYNDIRSVREAVPSPTILKVIIESAALEEAQIVGCCRVAQRAGADFVKTSTGFHPAGGATVDAVRVMAETVGSSMGIKASGGIRNRETALTMIAAGATRLGVSGTRSLLDGDSNGDGY